MSEIEKIDAVLGLMAKQERVFTNHNIGDELAKHYRGWKSSRLFERDLANIVIKLRKDGYIELGNTSGMGVPTDLVAYVITFEGKLFSQLGGYAGVKEKNRLAEVRSRISYLWNAILAIGVTTPFVWYLLDIAEKHYRTIYPFVRTVLVPYGAPTALLLLLLLLRRQYRR